MLIKRSRKLIFGFFNQRRSYLKFCDSVQAFWQFIYINKMMIFEPCVTLSPFKCELNICIKLIEGKQFDIFNVYSHLFNAKWLLLPSLLTLVPWITQTYWALKIKYEAMIEFWYSMYIYNVNCYLRGRCKENFLPWNLLEL